MSPIEFSTIAISVSLAIAKLGALGLAAVWLFKSMIGQRGLLTPGDCPDPIVGSGEKVFRA